LQISLHWQLQNIGIGNFSFIFAVRQLVWLPHRFVICYQAAMPQNPEKIVCHSPPFRV
jgi:hypothetical protein